MAEVQIERGTVARRADEPNDGTQRTLVPVEGRTDVRALWHPEVLVR
jgi:hypothetical protein